MRGRCAGIMAVDAARLELVKMVVHLPGEKVQEAVELIKSLSTRPGVVYNMAANDNSEFFEFSHKDAEQSSF